MFKTDIKYYNNIVLKLQHNLYFNDVGYFIVKLVEDITGAINFHIYSVYLTQ
jgi:hypothetical protein